MSIALGELGDLLYVDVYDVKGAESPFKYNIKRPASYVAEDNLQWFISITSKINGAERNVADCYSQHKEHDDAVKDAELFLMIVETHYG